MDLKKTPSTSKKITEAISKRVKEDKGSKKVDLNGVIKTLVKRNVQADNENEE